MRKVHREKKDYGRAQAGNRVLARALAEDLRSVQAGSGASGKLVTATVTDLGAQFDYTFKGSDGDSA